MKTFRERELIILRTLSTDRLTDAKALLEALGDPVDFDHNDQLRRDIDKIDPTRILRTSNGRGGWLYALSPTIKRCEADANGAGDRCVLEAGHGGSHRSYPYRY